MLRNLPSGGHPIPIRTILQSILGKKKGNNPIQSRFPEKPIIWLNSGTSALTFALKAISASSSRKKVVLPAYSCPSVLASVIKARLSPLLCDLEENSFRMNLDLLERRMGENTLAVIAVHLFGVPENIFEIRKMAREKGVFLIEDAAQAFGNRLPLESLSPSSASSNSVYLGSFGDIGIFSFGRGKPLSFLSGGAVLVNNSQFEQIVKEIYASIPESNHSPAKIGYLVNLFIYSIFYHPNLYWIPLGIPWLKLGETIFSLDFKINRITPHALQIGQALIVHYEKIRKKREEIAGEYKEKLRNLREEFVYLPEFEDDNINLLRFPLILKNKGKRDKILTELKKRRLGATGMYPVPLSEQEGVSVKYFINEYYPHAKHHAERIITLPLHEYVGEKDIGSICGIIGKHIAG